MDAPTAPHRDEQAPESAASPRSPSARSEPPEQIAFVGRILALTYDDHGRCDGFVLELACGAERCFELREPGMESALRRAFAARAPARIITAAATPRRPLAILPGEV